MDLAINTLVHKFVDTGYGRQEDVTNDECDGVLAYACGTLSMGLLFMEFGDAICEGDGNRIIRCWKYFLLHFKVERRSNYSIEALNLLAQYHFLLSPRMAMQLVWGRTVNTHGHG